MNPENAATENDDRENDAPENAVSPGLGRVSWRALETRTGLDALPAFHRAFLTWRGVQDADAMPLRRVSQRVEAELNRWVQSGQAQKREDDWLIAPGILNGFLEGRTPRQTES